MIIMYLNSNNQQNSDGMFYNIQMNCLFPSTTQPKVDRESLEFKDGIIQSYLTQPSNSISTNQYNLYTSPKLLFWFCIRPGNLFLIACCIVVNALKLQTNYDISFYLFPLLVSFVFFGIRQIKFDLTTRESDRKINHSITRVCTSEGVEDVSWGSLKVGDIVYLKQGDHVPADLLLLDSQELEHRSAIAYVDTSLISGYSKIDKKKAAYLSQLQSRGIQKQNWLRYRQILTGKLTYSQPTLDYNEFTGYLKLVKDPKVEQLSIENIILRGSIIKRSLWIFGMVVHAGHSCKIVMHQKRFTKRYRFHFFISYCEKIITFGLLLGITLSLVFSIVHINGLYISFAQTFLHYFLLFSPTIPYYLYPTLDIISFLLWWRYKDSINMKNPMVLPEIGCLDYLFLSKNGVLATGEVVIKQIMTPSCIYRIQEPQNDQKKTRNSRRSACRSQHIPSIVASILSSSSSRPLQFDKVISEANMTESDQFQIDDQPFTQKQIQSNLNDKIYQFQPLVLDKHKMLRNIMEQESEALTAALSMTLCHQAKLFYIHNDSQYKGISHNPVDEILLKFCKSLGINYAFFKKTDKYNMIKIIIKQDHMIFELVGAHQFKKKRDRVGVVVKRNNVSTVIVKGSAEKMLNIMNIKEDERMRLENKIAEYKEQGVQPIIFAKRELSSAQFATYQSQYLSVRLALTTTEKETEEFVNKYEKDLNFVAMIGMADELSPNYNNLALALSDLNIKFGILTSDLADTTINIAKKFISKAYKSPVQYIKLDEGSRSEIKYQVSETLTLIKNKEEFDFVLIMSQNTLDAVYASFDLLQHFLYLIYKSKSIIAYGLNSDVIGKLVKSIKNSSPTAYTVMSVGYSTYSLEMFKESDVSVSFHVDADIKVNSLKELISLLKNGKHFFHVTISTISTVIYVSLVLLAIFVCYQLLCYNYINVAIEPSMIWILSNVFMLWSIIICMVTVLSKESDEKSNPARYTAIRKQIFRHYFLLVFLKGITHGAVIALCVAFILPQAKISGIFSFTKASQNVIILLEVVSILLFRHFVKSSISILHRALIVVTTYIIMLISLTIRQALRSNIQFGYMYCIFLSYSSVVLIINTFVFNIAATYMYDQVIRNMFFPLLADSTPLEKYRVKNMKHIEEQQLITKMFREVEEIDTNVMESINEWGVDYTSMKFNSQLEFINQSLNYKYLFQNIDSDIKTFIVACIIYGIAALGCIINAVYEDGWTVSIKSSYFIATFTQLLIVTLIAYFLRGFFRTYHSYIGKMLLLLFIVGTIVEQLKTKVPEPLWLCLLGIFVTLYINLNVIVMIIFMAISVSFNFYTSAMNPTPERYILEIVGVVILLLINFSTYKTYLIEEKSKFLNEETFKNESDHIQDILSLLVPKFIHKYLQDGEYNLQEAQDDVSILFCYVCNFDTVVKEEGRNIVHLMDELFRQFDQLCHSYAVQKIETVGMTYMAATGISAVEEQFDSYLTKKNSVERLLKMSEIMMEKAKGIVYGKNKNKRLTLKIGIHTGKVIIGVIGYHKPQFSLIGDTVNTTSRHCSTAKESEIVLSAAAFKKLKYKSYHFTVGKVFMKGLGEVDIYRWGKQANPIKQIKDELNQEKNVRFRKIVRRVIEDLKKNNLILYKPVLERIRNIFEVRTSSQRISSMKSFKSASGLMKLMLEEDRVQETSAQTFNIHQLIIMALNYNISFSEFICKKYSTKDITIIVLSIIILWLHYAGVLVLLPFHPLQLALRFVSTFFLITSAVLLRRAYINLYLRVLVLILMGFVTASSAFELFYIDDVVNVNDFMTILLLLLFTTIGRIQLFNLLQLAILGLVGCFTPLIVSFAVNQKFNIQCIIILFFYMGEVMSRKYNRLQLAETMYKEIKIEERRSKEQEGLVSQLLPKHAFLKLRNQNLSNKIELTDVIEDATLLFADIKGFTSYSNQNPAEQVVTMLRTLFSEFDKTCLKYNVYKVYTIGDCYVVLGFTNPFRRDIHQQAINVVNMGLAMVDIVHTVRQQIDFQELDMRIGIHTGTIIGGIIGTDLVRYDIYGRDVMIANKFQEFGEIGKVHVSSATKAILESAEANFKMVPHGTVKIEKLNVELPGFLVSRRKFE